MHKPTSSFKKKLYRFIELGAVAPSSRFLARRMASNIMKRDGLTIVELGAGTGTITKAILKELPNSGRLIAIEIEEKSALALKHEINDERLEIIVGDAHDLSQHLKAHRIKEVDYIISGLPFGNFNVASVNHILKEIKKNLAPLGTYVQFQYYLANLRQIKKIFAYTSIRFEPRNLPPAFVMTCRKN